MNSFSDIALGCQGHARGVAPLLSVITEEISSKTYSRVSACAAYASFRGVVLVRTALSSAATPRFRWLLGLDDFITDPRAIRVAADTHNAESRIVPAVSGRRFHAKAYLLDDSPDETATLVIGSANLTQAALTKNCETYVLIRGRTKDEVSALQLYWELLWRTGEAATGELIRQYDEDYKRKGSHPAEITDESSHAPPTPQSKKLLKQSLHSSKLAWIELGYNTGAGLQLDIVKKLAPFLGLPHDPIQGTTRFLVFDSPKGQLQFQLTFTKGMWRFMNLQQGFNRRLRPNLEEPSPYVLIVSRSEAGATDRLSIQRLDSPRTGKMIEESQQSGFVDSSKADTSGRRFGWY
jgi:HKD family nuclease